MHYISKYPFMKTMEIFLRFVPEKAEQPILYLYFEIYEASDFLILTARKFKVKFCDPSKS